MHINAALCIFTDIIYFMDLYQQANKSTGKLNTGIEMILFICKKSNHKITHNLNNEMIVKLDPINYLRDKVYYL